MLATWLAPRCTADWVRELYFELGYTAHGGSGLGLSPAECGRLPYAELVWLRERLREERAQEVKAMRKAHKRGA